MCYNSPDIPEEKGVLKTLWLKEKKGLTYISSFFDNIFLPFNYKLTLSCIHCKWLKMCLLLFVKSILSSLSTAEFGNC